MTETRPTPHPHDPELRALEAKLGDTIRTSLFYDAMADEVSWRRADDARSDARRRAERTSCTAPRHREPRR